MSRPQPHDEASQPLQLRDYQNRIIDEIREKTRGRKSLLVCAPTGAGKTIVLAETVAKAVRKGYRAAVLVHRQELVKQTYAAVQRQCGVPPGVIWKGTFEWDAPALILAQNTVLSQPIPPALQGIPLLVVDEAHHTVAPSWLQTIERLAPKKLLGFSATPFRQDKEPLCPAPFEQVIRPITPKELIERDILCPARIESLPIHGANGAIRPIAQARNLPQLYLQAVQYAISQGRAKTLLYVSQTPKHTPLAVMKATAKALHQAGITACTVSQNLSARQREEEIQRFVSAPGASVLLNYIALTEGTDLPLVDCVIVGRHTASESTIIQMIGRGLRKHPQKTDCLVIDFTGRHDMEGIIHYWRLDQPRDKGGGNAAVREAKLDQAELERLSVKFARAITPAGTAHVEYAWFRPFPGRPLQALPITLEAGQPETYLTVEPQKNGKWRVSRLSLQTSGPAPVSKRQAGELTEEETLIEIRKILGNKAPMLARNAPWRLKEASESQINTIKRLFRNRPDEQPIVKLAGEASDAIAHERFRRRVNPRLL